MIYAAEKGSKWSETSTSEAEALCSAAEKISKYKASSSAKAPPMLCGKTKGKGKG